MTINAFHPDYVSTYMPQFMSAIRSESAAKENGKRSGLIARATRESDGKAKTSPLSNFPKTNRVSLAPTEFFTYSRAGMPKGVK